MQRTVHVWGKPQQIDVFPKSKTVWIAAADYHGERIETEGPTQDDAVSRWLDAARQRGE
jgi:hypothetical protein